MSITKKPSKFSAICSLHWLREWYQILYGYFWKHGENFFYKKSSLEDFIPRCTSIYGSISLWKMVFCAEKKIFTFKRQNCSL